MECYYWNNPQIVRSVNAVITSSKSSLQYIPFFTDKKNCFCYLVGALGRGLVGFLLNTALVFCIHFEDRIQALHVGFYFTLN